MMEKPLTWCVLHRLRQLHKVQLFSSAVFSKHTAAAVSRCGGHTGCRGNHDWPSHKIRTTFLDFFTSRDHEYVHSSPILPRKGDGTYFINAGMNQFKPVFLGTVAQDSAMASYRRVVNSQKCVRVGGKHNDLDDVGRDTYHHTFFEMLGSWSFGDYFKEEACTLAWQLLTQGYGLPPERLWVTYFGGDPQLDLAPDLETRDVWRQIGVSKDRVLPFGCRDNFWDMGETGPCGPCTEIHFAHTQDLPTAQRLVNTGDPRVMELWNLVFMQYDRQSDGSLRPLECHHVDTGMGLERLTAVLQGSTSNYDTDLFTPLFQHLHQAYGVPAYGGRVATADIGSRDTAYRILADHARMATVAIGDGLRPGRKDLDSKLRSVIHRCVRAAQVLALPPGAIASLVPLIITSLGSAFPELTKNPSQIAAVLSHAEERYLASEEQGERVLHKALRHYGSTAKLTGSQLYEMSAGRFGARVSLDMLCAVADRHGITADMEGLEAIQLAKREADIANRTDDPESPSVTLGQRDLEWLRSQNILMTDDSYKYAYSKEEGEYNYSAPAHTEVLALKLGDLLVSEVTAGQTCGMVLSATNMYAEAGGQAGDTGTLTTRDGEVMVTDVQRCGGYVCHTGTVYGAPLAVGDTVTIHLNEEWREGCACHHTATHLLHRALNAVLGGVTQQGSKVTSHKLTFDFTCDKLSVSESDLVAVAAFCDETVSANQTVHTSSVPLDEARSIPHIAMLPNEVYPSTVRVVSVGALVEQLLTASRQQHGHSIELCGGTHVHQTGDLDSLVITNLQGGAQGTKRITAVTGQLAQQAIQAGESLVSMVTELQTWVAMATHQEKWSDTHQSLYSMLTGPLMLPKLVRDECLSTLNQLETSAISIERNRQHTEGLEQKLKSVISKCTDEVIVVNLGFDIAREVARPLVSVDCSRPVIAVSSPVTAEVQRRRQRDNSTVCVIWLPQTTEPDRWPTTQEITDKLCAVCPGTVKVTTLKGKLSKFSNLLNVIIKDSRPGENMSTIEHLVAWLGTR